MVVLRNFNGLASWRNGENSLQSVNLTTPFGDPDVDRLKRSTILHALRAGGRLGATEARILTVLGERRLTFARSWMRDRLAHLEAHKPIEVERREADPWWAGLARRDLDITDYAVACETGIARPPKQHAG